ncbi:MAG: asparagine synthase (glutamine-hydrolyzing) [Thermoanaerobaculia bacterium]
MCGIFGFIGKRSVAESLDLQGAIASLRHRGPDGEGTFLGPSRVEAGIACAFAHTRLAIIDLSAAGRQPMTTADGRYTLIFNGEVYNFRALRAELERSGSRFTSHTDSEVVLQAFATWGPRCVPRLRGIFAFAIWDRDDGKLFLARDHVGVKPLYYAERPDGLAFASEVRALLRAGLAGRRMSAAALDSYLTYGSVQDPLTILDGVFALLPGHTATYANGRLVLEPYWQLKSDIDKDVTFDGAVERIRPVLQDAVAMQLVADVPLGVFLSGGVDSSALVALASMASGKPVHTFTVTFDETAYSEEKYAAAIASRFGCEHHRVHLPGDRAVSEFDRFVDALDQPSADGVNTFFVAEAAREAGLAVALSGSGGDEVFAGYPNFRSFGRLMTVGRLARPAAPLLSKFLGSVNGTSIRAKKFGAIVDAGGDPLATYAALRSMFSPKQVRTLMGRDSSAAPKSEDLDTSDPIDLYSQLELTHYLRNTLLRDADVMSMAHSLEVRVPLVDHELVSCVAAIPGRLKIGATSKPLLTAACGSLPQEVGARPKMGFTLPMDVWFRGPLREKIAAALSRRGPLDVESVRSLWQSFLSGSRSVSWSRVWTLAALLEWSERNGVAPA